MSTVTTPGIRRGRPPEAERAARRERALDAALEEVQAGYERMTMSAVAARAGSSKESLYSWFGDKEGMIGALIRRQSARTNAAVERALDGDQPPRTVLTTIAANLLGLLTGEASVALNRAAMGAPALAALLLEHGRHTTGPLVEGYLRRLHDEGVLALADPEDAFRLLYGLAVQDAQIRVLLGEPPPSTAVRDGRAELAVARFLALAGARATAPASVRTPSTGDRP